MKGMFCRVARWLVHWSPRGRFALTEYSWRFARRISAFDAVKVNLASCTYYLRPLQYRTEFYLYCLREEFSNREDAAFTAPLIRAGDTVLDLGANIGNFSVPVAKAVGPEGRVIAVEPCLEIFRRLLIHTKVNDTRNIVPLRLAIGEKDDEAFLANGQDVGEASLAKITPAARFKLGDRELEYGEWVPQMTLD